MGIDTMLKSLKEAMLGCEGVSPGQRCSQAGSHSPPGPVGCSPPAQEQVWGGGYCLPATASGQAQPLHSLTGATVADRFSDKKACWKAFGDISSYMCGDA
ncbi:hypothetical protein Y1Q_0019612 [Alligator mississippiensis]|uniref:Uncharacterized protein n=1 Tax=Alligator mississippiensis TaxID=8496 RepID=A0A151PEL3_ALLMI|nr:hypothetical protein Y1Q_0019612 [Alligator mississippiensis]